MRKLIFLFATLFMFSGTYAQDAATDGRDQFTVKVDGLGCPFCAYGLEKKFKEFKGIDDVKIEMETGIFTFSYPTADALAMDKVENQVDAAGYTAVTVDVTRANGETESLGGSTTELTAESEIVEQEIYVAGNCGMCKARIDKTAKAVNGVTEAAWNKKSKMLTVSFDTSQTTASQIEEAIATSGHDTTNAKANDDTYDSLPGCCQYEREQ